MTTEEIVFEGDQIVRVVECMKATNGYEKKTLAEKMAFKADVTVEFLDKVMESIHRAFPDLPAYDPMFMGQHMQRVMERLFPEHVEEMQFRWIPYLLSSETAPLFPVCIESSRYVRLRAAAHRNINLPGFAELPEDEKAHITAISDGRMPPGVLGTHHSAWLLCDPLKSNEPLNSGAVHRFLEEQKQPSGTRPKTEAEINAELNGES
jgi:hypothetical protein